MATSDEVLGVLASARVGPEALVTVMCQLWMCHEREVACVRELDDARMEVRFLSRPDVVWDRRGRCVTWRGHRVEVTWYGERRVRVRYDGVEVHEMDEATLWHQVVRARAPGQDDELERLVWGFEMWKMWCTLHVTDEYTPG
jgi:hypothetical protein